VATVLEDTQEAPLQKPDFQAIVLPEKIYGAPLRRGSQITVSSFSAIKTITSLQLFEKS
jgi:hypothetical protein